MLVSITHTLKEQPTYESNSILREWSFFNNRGGGWWIFARAGRNFFGPPAGGVEIFLVPPSGRLKLSAANPFEL